MSTQTSIQEFLVAVLVMIVVLLCQTPLWGAVVVHEDKACTDMSVMGSDLTDGAEDGYGLATNHFVTFFPGFLTQPPKQCGTSLSPPQLLVSIAGHWILASAPKTSPPVT